MIVPTDDVRVESRGWRNTVNIEQEQVVTAILGPPVRHPTVGAVSIASRNTFSLKENFQAPPPPSELEQ